MAEGMVGDPYADGALLRVQQSTRHLAGSGKDERVGPGGRGADRAEDAVGDLRELPELGEVRAHQREVVLLVEVADRQDPFASLAVAHPGAERVPGVRGIGDQRVVVAYCVRDLLDQSGLRVVRMYVDVAGHPPESRVALAACSQVRRSGAAGMRRTAGT